MFAFVQKWLASKGGFAHVVAASYLSIIAAYVAVPAFAHLLNSVYALMPSWAHEFILAALGIVAWYTNMRKQPAKV